jgi:hypothetical protein
MNNFDTGRKSEPDCARCATARPVFDLPSLYENDRRGPANHWTPEPHGESSVCRGFSLPWCGDQPEVQVADHRGLNASPGRVIRYGLQFFSKGETDRVRLYGLLATVAPA